MAHTVTWLRGGTLLALGAWLMLAGACSSQQEASLSALHYFQKGNAAYQAEDYRRAIAHYKMALQFDDESPDIYYNLGLAYYRVAAYDDAVEAYQRALKLDPGFSDAHLNLALAYDKLYNSAAADLHYNRYRALATGNKPHDAAPTAASSQSAGGSFQPIAATSGGGSQPRTSGFEPVSNLPGVKSAGGPRPGTSFSMPQTVHAGAGARLEPEGAGSSQLGRSLAPPPVRRIPIPTSRIQAGQPEAPANPFKGNPRWWTQDAASPNP
jgi:tetratricopeptide (TPR) repeat protein